MIKKICIFYNIIHTTVYLRTLFVAVRIHSADFFFSRIKKITPSFLNVEKAALRICKWNRFGGAN